MVNTKKLLSDIYKYYPSILDDNTKRKSKSILRLCKIEKKSKLSELIEREPFHRLSHYAVIDWTDRDACCYEFKILLHKNQAILDDDTKLIKVLGGTRYDLRVFISVLEPYYYMFVEKTQYNEKTNKWTFETIKNLTKEVRDIKKTINDYLYSKGYTKLLENEVRMIVPDVKTDFKAINEVNVFDCLFTDLVDLVEAT